MKPNRRAFLKAAVFASSGLAAACTQTGPFAETPIPSPTAPAPEPSPTDRQEITVLAEGLNFPEGPAFDSSGGLWCTELGSGNLVRLEAGGRVRRYPTGGRPNGLAFDRSGRAWVTDSEQNAIRRFDPDGETWETLLDGVDGRPLLSPNDLSFDARGNLVFTCPNFASEERSGYVVCLRPDGTAKKVGDGFFRPNGLDIVDGGGALVVADTYQKTLFKGAWNAESADWHDPKPWAQVGGSEGPDGMVPGADGLLYQAIYGDGVVRVIDPEGQIVEEIALPGANPTNAAVDPSGRFGLVVTETEKGQLLSLPWIQPGAAIFDGGDAWD